MRTPRNIKKRIIDYLEGTLKEPEKGPVSEYLSQHPELSHEINEYIKIKELTNLQAEPELPEAFWQEYLPSLKKRMAIGLIPAFSLIKLASGALASLSLILASVFITLNIYQPETLSIESLSRADLAAELVQSNIDIDTFVSENFESEDLVVEFLPENIIYSLKGGGLYESF